MSAALQIQSFNARLASPLPTLFLQYDHATDSVFSHAGFIYPVPTSPDAMITMLARVGEIFPGLHVEMCPILKSLIDKKTGVETGPSAICDTLRAMNDKAVAGAPMRKLIREVLEDILEEYSA